MPIPEPGASTILVTGARGAVARAVIDRLLAAGHRVRAASRQPESVALPASVEVVRADLATGDTLTAALAGVSRVFLYAEPRGIDGLLAAARGRGRADRAAVVIVGDR